MPAARVAAADERSRVMAKRSCFRAFEAVTAATWSLESASWRAWVREMCEAMKAPATSGAPTTARKNSVRRARNVISASASARCDPGLDTFCSRTDEIVPRTTEVPTERAQARVLVGLIGALAAL